MPFTIAEMGVAKQRRGKGDQPASAPLSMKREDTPATGAIMGRPATKVPTLVTPFIIKKA
jgi:hypothetical protein